MSPLRKTVSTLATALIMGTALASAQVQMETLGPADVYDPGTLEPGQGGLDAQLWQGTSSERATLLIGNINAKASRSARDLAINVLLSAGIPPQADGNLARERYIATRLETLVTLDQQAAFETITARSNLDTSSPAYVKIFTEQALLSGQSARACGFADTIRTERKAPYWAKLRAYCHFTRDEIPAAELTTDILRRNDHEDAAFFTLLGNLTGSEIKPPKAKALKTALHIAMAQTALKDAKINAANVPPALARMLAMDVERESSTRLSALKRSAHMLTREELEQILYSFSDTPDTTALEDTTTLPTDKDWTATQWGQAFAALRTSTDITRIAGACSILLTQAERVGILEPVAQVLAQDIAVIPHDIQAHENPSVFARIAVQNGEIETLRGLYQNLEAENPLRGRIALASDALGNGFLLTELGMDIETRLTFKGDKKARAVRDTYIAVGLGSQLSQSALDTLLSITDLSGYVAPPGALLALQEAARRRAQAETVLWAAQIIDTHSLGELRADTFSALLTALNAAGLNGLAGQLAARDFLNGY